MINRILNNSVQAISNLEIKKKPSEDELKDIYRLVQSFRILVIIVWTFSGIASYFVGNLLNPGSSLLEWSLDHEYVIIIAFLAFLYMPATILSYIALRMEPLTQSLYVSQSFKFLSPKQVWIVTASILFVVVPFLAFIVSFYQA